MIDSDGRYRARNTPEETDKKNIEEITTYRCKLCNKKHETHEAAQACVNFHLLPVSVSVHTDGTSYVSTCALPTSVLVTMSDGIRYEYRLEVLY